MRECFYAHLCPRKRSLVNDKDTLWILETLMLEETSIELGSALYNVLRQRQLLSVVQSVNGAFDDQEDVRSPRSYHYDVVNEIWACFPHFVLNIPVLSHVKSRRFHV